jgi:hypothetical protein
LASPRQKTKQIQSSNYKNEKTSIISSMALGCLALAMGLALAPKAHAAKPVTATQTGQSIMVNLKAEGTYAIVETNSYIIQPSKKSKKRGQSLLLTLREL